MFRIAVAAALFVATPALAQQHVHGSDADSPVPAHQRHPVDSTPMPTPEGAMETLQVPGGGTALGFYDAPKDPRGAVLVLHEWWGLNDHIKSEVAQLKQKGYAALAVDLYGGKVAQSPAEAGDLMKAVDDAHAAQIEKAGLEFLHAHAPKAKIATLGWCFGGGESLNATLAAPELVSGTVIYYGMPTMDVAKLKTLRGPVLGIWANKDGWITPEKVAQFDKALTAAGIVHEFHAYDADHAFANPTGGKYNPPAAQDANRQRDAFLAKLFGAK